MDAVRNQIDTPYPQPLAQQWEYQLLHGMQEEIDYLPGTSLRIWYTHLPDSFPEHWHNVLEIITGEREHYVVEAEGVQYQVHPDDILLIPGGIRHTLRPVEGCNGFVYLLNIDFLNVIKSASRMLSLLAHPLFITPKSNAALHLSAASLLRQVREVYFSENDLRELLIDAYLLMLMEQLLSYSNGLHASGRCDTRQQHHELFTEVINYINHNYMEEMTVEDIAHRCGLSKFYFSRLFKQYTMHTFCEYLAFRRLKAAEQLMTDASLSITDIAYRAGFSSLSSFSRVFRSQKNCTPSEYRRIYARNLPLHGKGE